MLLWPPWWLFLPEVLPPRATCSLLGLQASAAPTQPAKIDRDSAQVTHGPRASTIRATQDAPPASIGRIGIALLVRPAPLKRQYDVGTPVTARPSVQIFPLQPHLHIELEVIFLSIRTYGIVDLKLLIVFVHLRFAAGTSLGLDRSGELCAFVLGNLANGERRQRRYGE